MTIQDIVSVTINSATASLDRASFGTPLLVAYHTHFPDRTREYKKLADMVTDGFALTEPAYLMAAALKRQNPSVKAWKVGRRALAPVPTYGLTVTDATEGKVLSLTIEGTTLSYTVLASATTTTVATAIELLTEAVTGVNSSSSGAVVTIVPASTNDQLSIGGLSTGLQIKDNTPDPGLATDLTAIEAFDANWYGVLIDSESEAQINALAAWVETRKVVAMASCIDTVITDSGTTTDIASDLKGFGYSRTLLLYDGQQNQQYAAAAWMGKLLPKDPGSATAAYKTLKGIVATALSGAQESALVTKRCNYYASIKGRGVTIRGVLPSGEKFDIVWFIDWLQARTEERFFALLANNDKLDFSNKTGDLVRAELLAQFQEGVAQKGLLPNSKDQPHIVTVPDVKDVSTADKADRILPDIAGSAYLAGAVEELQITINLSL